MTDAVTPASKAAEPALAADVELESTKTPVEAEPALDYEAAQRELTQIVAQLEAGQVSLTESLQLWQRGEELVRICEEFLAGARQQLAQVQAADDAENGDTPQ